jgi:hypothetical protein
MGLVLRADESAAPPRPVSMVLTCDKDHGLFPSPILWVDVSVGHPRDIAASHGWKITADGPVLCPGCARTKCRE